MRRIASNLLWRPQGLLRDPLVEVGPDGRVLRVERCADPDRRAFTEFYGGLLVPGFPGDVRSCFAGMLERRGEPLEALLAELLPAGAVPEDGGCLVLLSGLDYDPLRLTDRSRLRVLAGPVAGPDAAASEG